MSTTKTIEELKAELAAAEQKLYEEKQELIRKEREIKYAAEKAEREAKEKEAMLKFETVAKEIVKELKAVGFINANYILPDSGKYPDIRCFAADNYVEWQVAFEDSYNRDSWRSRVTGTVITVGQYGEKSRYPQLKAGGFNYKKIAATAWEKYQTALAKQKRINDQRSAEASNKQRIENILNKYGKKPYDTAEYKKIDGVNLSYYVMAGNSYRDNRIIYRSDNDLMLKVEHITEENAAKLIKFMLDNGMIDNKEEE